MGVCELAVDSLLDICSLQCEPVLTIIVAVFQQTPRNNVLEILAPLVVIVVRDDRDGMFFFGSVILVGYREQPGVVVLAIRGFQKESSFVCLYQFLEPSEAHPSQLASIYHHVLLRIPRACTCPNMVAVVYN